MSGMIPHPDRDDLHGITVVVTGRSGKTYVGRWHEKTAKGVLLRGVAVHDPAIPSKSLEEWLLQLRKFGVPPTEHHLLVADEEFSEVQRFAD